METQEILNNITNGFDGMAKARKFLFDAAENTMEAKKALEAEKASASLSGKFDGKNAEIREAQAREYLAHNISVVELAEKEERQARLAFDLASLGLEYAKALLRIAELGK